ncbi:MAG: DedA family protein [Candidatus Komeilibacteria bacterium]|nr:DedA family protein [Candidatus Komeilibacteria bacterium]
MGLTEFLAEHITNFINALGYPSVFLLMTAESMIFPIPSEAVMPFAGFLIASGDFTFLGVIFFSTLGSLVGSLLSYWIGQYGGRALIAKWGKYFLLNEADLNKTENFFKQKGELTIFVSRFIPIVRHLISLPAGLAKMNLLKFCVYTVIGAGLWNTFLAAAGFYLKNNWDSVIKYTEVIDLLMLGLLILAALYFVKKHFYQKS